MIDQMRRILLILGIALLGIESVVMAQDAQFSQFYAAPLYLNPALAGGTNQTRVGLNYRSQWPAIDATFTTTSLFIDHFLEDYNSGVGFIISRDMEGLAGLRSLSIGAQYSY
jgi:type IX secretion system PorP/SprF family membrane protein